MYVCMDVWMYVQTYVLYIVRPTTEQQKATARLSSSRPPLSWSHIGLRPSSVDHTSITSALVGYRNVGAKQGFISGMFGSQSQASKSNCNCDHPLPILAVLLPTNSYL